MFESPELQFAHVLFMDIVGYSTRDNPGQLLALQELQSLVRSQPEFRRASAAGDLLSLPTGDGMALVFFREPVAPLQCAVQIGRALRNRTDLQLRMGLHSGPVYRVEDINANANVSGGGINLAQRVMDCGDAGHILVSAAIREQVVQVGAWPMEDLGEYAVKHGRPVHLFNVYGTDFGNRARPRRPGPATLAGRKVVLLYRRGAHPDEALLEELAARLSAHGCDLFWDRHLKVGMKWAEEIGRRIWEADAVIPLVSATSMHSEMLAEELQQARAAAERQEGRPRILPVRIGHTGSLPEGIALVLDPIEYALWESAADTERLLEALVEGLEAPQPEQRDLLRPGPRAIASGLGPGPLFGASSPTVPETSSVALEAVGGAVPLDSRFYLERASDAVFLGAIERRDSIVLVNGARQMGKTSLLARGLQQARRCGARVVLTDLQWLNAEQMDSADGLFRALGDAIADQLDLDTFPEEVWNPRSGASVNFQRYMRRVVLGTGGPVVWGLDEVDRLFTCPFGSEVFGLFRSWHNARALDPTGPWSQLTLAIAYATEAHLFITDVNQSPFNVGTRVALADFTLPQVSDLNERYGRPLRGEGEPTRFHRLLNGHPYLTRRGLNELAGQGLSLTEFEGSVASNEGPFGDHLRRILILLARDPELREVVRGILQGQPCPTPEYFYRLRSAGLMVGDTPREARPRCPLYATYLERHLL